MSPGRRRALIACLGTLLVWAGAGVLPSARADVTLSVTPSLVELDATPGGTGTIGLRLLNKGSEPFAVKASVESMKDASQERSAVDWLRVLEDRITLNPGEQRILHVKVSIPTGLHSGGRYALVSLETGAKRVQAGGAGVAGKVAVPFLVTVRGSGSLSRVVALDRLEPLLQTNGRVGFVVRLVDQGNLHVFAKGVVSVADANGNPVGQAGIPESTPILPKTSRPLATEDALRLRQGETYTATASIDYGGARPAVASRTFTVQTAAAIDRLSVHENADTGPTIDLGLRNSGRLALLPVIDMSVEDAAGTFLGTASAPPPLIWPTERAETRTLYPHLLANGTYRLSVTVKTGFGPPLTRSVVFRIGAAPANRPGAFGRPAPGAGLPLWIVLAAIAGVIGLLAAVLATPPFSGVRRRFRRAWTALTGAE